MSVIPFGRAEPAAPKSERGGGSPKATPRVDIRTLKLAVTLDAPVAQRARSFIAYLQATGQTGPMSVDTVEEIYRKLMCGDLYDADDWSYMWISMSRALGKLCNKKQNRINGARKQVIVIPEAPQ